MLSRLRASLGSSSSRTPQDGLGESSVTNCRDLHFRSLVINYPQCPRVFSWFGFWPYGLAVANNRHRLHPQRNQRHVDDDAGGLICPTRVQARP